MGLEGPKSHILSYFIVVVIITFQYFQDESAKDGNRSGIVCSP